jgi:hypothetical protein
LGTSVCFNPRNTFWMNLMVKQESESLRIREIFSWPWQFGV